MIKRLLKYQDSISIAFLSVALFYTSLKLIRLEKEHARCSDNRMCYHYRIDNYQNKSIHVPAQGSWTIEKDESGVVFHKQALHPVSSNVWKFYEKTTN